MRLVAVGTSLVSRRRAVLLGSVTSDARFGLVTGMRLVAARALGVATVHGYVLFLVTATAAGEQRFRSVWQARMAPLAGGVPCVSSRLVHGTRVTAGAHLVLVERDGEVVRLVALHARYAGVARVIRGRELMAVAARFGSGAGVNRRRMRVVATDAAAHDAALRMIWMHGGVAALASRFG